MKQKLSFSRSKEIALIESTYVIYNFNNDNERNYSYRFSLQAKDRLNDAYLVCDLKSKLRNVENNKHFFDLSIFIRNFEKFKQ